MTSKDPYSRVDYRRLVAWPERIRREWPFLETVLASGPSRRILDLGSGTGEHARFLAAQGFQVVGIDRSESMLASAREEPVPENLQFVLGSITEVARLTEGQFGAAICLGNTLPHLVTDAELADMLSGLRARLAAGAPLLLQVLNYERIFSRRERHLPLNFRPDDEGEIVFLRLLEPQDDGTVLFFPSTLRLRPDHDPPLELVSSKRVHLRGWRPSEVEAAMEAAGFGERRLYGDFEGNPLDPAESRDLIVVAR
jgi:glycine/sarcosine N-methyltransferase